ncbi:MAG: sulfite exporter TauE/SafE family protein [Desulfuromonadaceae bacterium]|nr:sulfite exporter TauE/SafE family protein [Desulfuromonadaceae bacterium]
MTLTLFFISCIGGFVSGLLGVGGAVVLIPLLLSVPPLLGVGTLDIHSVSAITMIQVLVTSALGTFIHRRAGNIHAPSIMLIGIPMGLSALLGAVFSRYVTADVLLITFGVLVLIPFFIFPPKGKTTSLDTDDPFHPQMGGGVAVGAAVGLVSGLVGAGGGFVLVPLLVTVLKFPLKMAVGSSLGIVLIGALLGSAGKIATLQVQWSYAVPVLLGSVPMVHLGSSLCRHLSARYIRFMFLALLVLVALDTWANILLRSG